MVTAFGLFFLAPFFIRCSRAAAKYPLTGFYFLSRWFWYFCLKSSSKYAFNYLFNSGAGGTEAGRENRTKGNDCSSSAAVYSPTVAKALDAGRRRAHSADTWKAQSARVGSQIPDGRQLKGGRSADDTRDVSNRSGKTVEPPSGIWARLTTRPHGGSVLVTSRHGESVRPPHLPPLSPGFVISVMRVGAVYKWCKRKFRKLCYVLLRNFLTSLKCFFLVPVVSFELAA